MKMVVPRAWISSILKSSIFTTPPPSFIKKEKKKKKKKKKPTLALSERGCVEMS